MGRFTTYAVFVGVLSALGAVSPPQQVEPPILSVRTNLVTLSVTVADRRGNLVTGLRGEDFTIYDDGQPQKIEFFSSEDLAGTIGLVIDSSGSMRGRRQDVINAAAAFASISHPLDEFFTVNFNEAVWLGLPQGVLFTENREQLRAAMAAAPAKGLTAIYDAVDIALDHLQLGTRDRKALIVVSDGGDNASSRTLDAVVEHARRTDAVIYALSLVDPDSHDARPRVLKRLADESGGRVFTPGRRADDVMTAFTRIARDIRSGYTIGFSPADEGGGFRPIRVVVGSGDTRFVARTRAGYYAEPSAGTNK